MYKRKILAFICTAIISIPIIGLVFMFIEGSTLTELPGLMAFTSIYATPVILLFGLPVSILSDKINNRFDSSKRVFFSLVIHLFFSTSFIVLLILILDSRFILTDYNSFDLYFLVAATLTSFIGWGMDEILRTYFRKNQKTFY